MTDPLPPSAALPLREGENTLLDSDGFNVPLTEGDERERHCRERRGSLTTTFCAKPQGGEFYRISSPVLRERHHTSEDKSRGAADRPPGSQAVRIRERAAGGPGNHRASAGPSSRTSRRLPGRVVAGSESGQALDKGRRRGDVSGCPHEALRSLPMAALRPACLKTGRVPQCHPAAIEHAGVPSHAYDIPRALSALTDRVPRGSGPWP